ncbi:MAG: SURF1 family protein [Pseudomonadota bacterium]
MFSRYRFHFRPVLSVAVLIALAILLSLGNWQMQRLAWKQALIANVEARVNMAPIPFLEAVARARSGESMEYAPVSVSGKIIPGNEALVFGTYDGAPGAYVFSGFQTNMATVYVNQGFVPQTILKGPGFDATGEMDERSVVGLFRYAEEPSPPASWLKPTGRSVDGFWYIRDPQHFAELAGVETPPYYIDELAVAGRQWPMGGTTRLQFNNRHLEYALTWFGLAATLIGVWIAFSLQKRRH